jgi:hypothetical protein
MYAANIPHGIERPAIGFLEPPSILKDLVVEQIMDPASANDAQLVDFNISSPSRYDRFLNDI